MPLDTTALRQAHEAGDLKHADVEALINQAEEQATTITNLERKLDLGRTWVRSHHRARVKAEEVLARNVGQAIRGCAKIAKQWPKRHLKDFFPGTKPTQAEQRLAHLVAGGIETHILNQLKEE